VQPGGELRIAPKLAQADAELRERILRCVPSVLAIRQEVARETLDARCVPLAQRGDRRPWRV